MARILNPKVEPVTGYYSPPRKLKNSVASQGDGSLSDFPAEQAGIPDKFATTEHPKLKFMFSVQFFPRSEDLVLPDNGSVNMDELIFALKRASRPNIGIVYQNVNFYNYRSAVATKIEYGSNPASLTFYDDNSNRALGVIIAYLTSMSPAFSRGIEEASNLNDEGSSSIQAMINAYGPLAAIRVAHHSFNPDDPTKLQSIYYDYLNPKITTITLDDLDMTSSDVTEVEFSFNYDTVKITTEQSAAIEAKFAPTVNVGQQQVNPTVSVGAPQSNVGIS